MTRPLYAEILPASRPTLDALRVQVAEVERQRLAECAVYCASCEDHAPMYRHDCGRQVCLRCLRTCCKPERDLHTLPLDGEVRHG